MKILLSLQSFLTNFGNTIYAILKVLILSRRVNLKKTGDREECIIMGNGPSLIKWIESKAAFIKDKDIFSVNHFPSSNFYDQVKPKYFVTAAPELWIKGVDELYIQSSRKLFTDLANKTTWPLILFIPFQARKYKDWKTPLENNKDIRINYYNDTGIEGWDWIKHFFFKNNLAMPRPHNVLIPAILLAINLGYKKIYLWGAENNQVLDLSVNEENIALINQKHFYDHGSSRPEVMKKRGTGQRHVHEILHKFMLSFMAYHVLDKYAEHRNAEVINQTPDSLIDAFDRQRL
jgi:hypothetical protein